MVYSTNTILAHSDRMIYFRENSNRSFALVVFRMEFDKTRWSCPWNSDQNCTHNSARGWWGSRGRGGGGQGGRGGRVGVVEVKGVGVVG